MMGERGEGWRRGGGDAIRGLEAPEKENKQKHLKPPLMGSPLTHTVQPLNTGTFCLRGVQFTLAFALDN